MPLKAVLDAAGYEALEPTRRELYVEKDGKWILDAEVPPGSTDAAMRALEHERKQRADAVRARDDGAQKLATLQAELDALRAKSTEAPPADQTQKEAERLRREYDDRIKAVESKLAKAEEKAAAAETRLAETSITDTLRAAAIDAGIDPERVEDLITLPRFRSPWKYHEGSPTVFDGEMPRLDPDKAGANMTAKSYVREFLKENKGWQPPSSGSGATGANRANGTPAAHVITRAQAENVDSYRTAKATAEKAGVPLRVEG